MKSPADNQLYASKNQEVENNNTSTILPLVAYGIVFTTSACGLTLEIVAGRILAPSIGVSLYTWTSIIGICLAGISLGNYLGGVLADRRPQRHILGLVLFSSGLSSLAILPLIELTSGQFDNISIMFRIVVLTTILFFFPSLLMGMVTPIVVKLRLNNIAQAGNIVGKTYAVSTAGSIFGTFITGFFLIQWIGTRSIVLAVAIVILLLSVAVGRLWEIRRPGAALLTIFIGLMALVIWTGALRSHCEVESSYFCITISEEKSNGRDIRVLILDKLVHSHVDLDDPTFLVYGYEKVLGDISTYVGERKPNFRSLFIGGGGYTMPRFIDLKYPKSHVEVIEIDPAVTDVVHDYFGMPRDTQIVTYNQDARAKLLELPLKTYDLIVGDAFDHFSVPYHLTTLEFNELVKDLLADDGIYTVNIVDKLHEGRMLRAIVNTMQKTFKNVYVMRDFDDWNLDDRHTFVVAGTDIEIMLSDIEKSNTLAGRFNTTSHIMPSSTLITWLNSKENILLTDDYVPVDNLLAPLFLEDG